MTNQMTYMKPQIHEQRTAIEEPPWSSQLKKRKKKKRTHIKKKRKKKKTYPYSVCVGDVAGVGA